MRLFVRIAETGGFSRAARAAGVGQSTASKQIALLEERLGARLLQRTSRRLNLTDEGQAYYEASVRLLGEVDAAEIRDRTGRDFSRGRHTSGAIGRFRPHVCRAAAARILCLLSDLAVDVNVSERHVNLFEDGLDVAICIAFLTRRCLRDDSEAWKS